MKVWKLLPPLVPQNRCFASFLEPCGPPPSRGRLLNGIVFMNLISLILLFRQSETPEFGRFCIKKTFFEHAKLHRFARNFLCYKKAIPPRQYRFLLFFPYFHYIDHFVYPRRCERTDHGKSNRNQYKYYYRNKHVFRALKV